MVKIMENPIKMDDLGGKVPLFLVQHPFSVPVEPAYFPQWFLYESVLHGRK